MKKAFKLLETQFRRVYLHLPDVCEENTNPTDRRLQADTFIIIEIQSSVFLIVPPCLQSRKKRHFPTKSSKTYSSEGSIVDLLSCRRYLWMFPCLPAIGIGKIPAELKRLLIYLIAALVWKLLSRVIQTDGIRSNWRWDYSKADREISLFYCRAFIIALMDCGCVQS